MAYRDPDDSLVPLFKSVAKKNDLLSREAGRDIYEDTEIVEIRKPGSKDWAAFPATAVSHWDNDPETGGQVQVTYAERFRRQYQQFKMHSSQTKTGTPLATVSFLSEARKAEMRAQNIYTVEMLAAIDGPELKNLGPGGRDLKNLAMEYIEEGRRLAPSMQLQAELEALKARNAILEEDAAHKQALEATQSSEFKAMTIEQLREYITVNSGQAPIGAMNKNTLIRMAEQCRPEKVA